MKLRVFASAIALALGMGSALAADLPSTKAPVYVPPPPLTWSGAYLGVNLGGGWTANSTGNQSSAYWDPTFPFLSSQTFLSGGAYPNLLFLPNGQANGNVGGVVGGGQDGYNLQLYPSIVVGYESDIQGTSISGNRSGAYSFYPSPFAGSANFLIPVAPFSGSKIDLGYIGTVRGRAGWLVTPTLLLYGTAGFAYGGVNPFGFSNTRTGWTAGGGVEWMFAPRWSAKVEYLYADLSGGGATGAWGWNWGYHVHPQVNIVRVGVNYHFDWWGVVGSVLSGGPVAIR